MKTFIGILVIVLLLVGAGAYLWNKFGSVITDKLKKTKEEVDKVKEEVKKL